LKREASQEEGINLREGGTYIELREGARLAATEKWHEGGSAFKRKSSTYSSKVIEEITEVSRGVLESEGQSSLRNFPRVLKGGAKTLQLTKLSGVRFVFVWTGRERPIRRVSTLRKDNISKDWGKGDVHVTKSATSSIPSLKVKRARTGTNFDSNLKKGHGAADKEEDHLRPAT